MNKNDYTPEQKDEILDDLFACLSAGSIQFKSGRPIKWNSLELPEDLTDKLVRVNVRPEIHKTWQGQVGTVNAIWAVGDINYFQITLYDSGGLTYDIAFRRDQLTVLK